MSTHKLLDPEFIDKIIFEVKSQGQFDAFRKECLADVDTQPAYQNLHSRVEDTVQRFLNRQVWTPEIKNKNRLREEMRMNIIRAGFLESGVSRIVDQVVEQKMDSIQSKVEEILYKYVGIEKPKKEEKNNGSLEVDTTLLLPTDLEQVSPDSDKKSSDSVDIKEEVEEEIVNDDFESPAFEPIEPIKNENNSNLSEISGLTSQDSAENKSHKSEEPTVDEKDNKLETALSQVSSTQDNIPDTIDTPVAGMTLTAIGISGEEAQMAIGLNDSTENESNANKIADKEKKEEPVFQFDLNKDTIEFTGTERKSINLDDSTSGESEKVVQPQNVQSMEIDNLYENDTSDSSEMKMEIDLKDETTQETGNSSKIEESSMDSTKDKNNKDKKGHKRDHSRDRDRKSSSKSSKSHHRSSSSSKSKHDESSRHKPHKSSSTSHKKSSSDRDRSSSSSKRDNKDKEKEKEKDSRKSESSSKSSRPKHEGQKPSDDHQQEKSSRRRRSTDHDSNDSKDASKVKNNLNSSKTDNQPKNSTRSEKCDTVSVGSNQKNEKTTENKATTVVDKMLSENCEMSIDAPKVQQNNSKAKEPKSSILVKYDYLKSKAKEEEEDELRGFETSNDEITSSLWFKSMQLMASNNNNQLTKKQEEPSSNAKKVKRESNQNGVEELTKSQTMAQQQRYDANDLYKPKFDFRRGRRGHVDDNSGISKEVSNE